MTTNASANQADTDRLTLTKLQNELLALVNERPSINLWEMMVEPNFDEIYVTSMDPPKTELDIAIDEKRAELAALHQRTIDSPEWVGYIEPGKSASIFIDNECLWVSDKKEKIGELSTKMIDGRVVIAAGQRQAKCDLGIAVTKERLKVLAEEFGAKEKVVIDDWRFYGARSHKELPDDFDSEEVDSYSTRKQFIYWIQDDEFQFLPFG